MTRLRWIQSAVQQIAEAITAALGLETEIIDDELTIVAGTGRYKKKIGLQEEDGDKDSGYIYGQLLKSGETYLIEEAGPEPPYGGLDNELAEICCPILLEEKVIGLIAMVAFTPRQQRKLVHNAQNYLIFLQRMAFLIASKISQVEISNELNVILETIRDGILAIDVKGSITACNATAEKLMNISREKLLGNPLLSYWSELPLDEILKRKVRSHEYEIIYRDHAGKQRHFLVAADPIVVKQQDHKQTGICAGAVFTFREFHDVKKMLYHVTEQQQRVCFDDIIGSGYKIRETVERARLIAQSNSTVLITGESGTGKELFARAVHYGSGRRREPFITVNCAAIPESLLESELFGYDSGAFTGARSSGKAGKFELAHGGTIFLDEIGDLPLHLQGKLLHVLQSREIERVGGTRVIPVDVRVIAATNRDLTQMMRDGEYREDLYFRLCVIPLHVPALRERDEDVETLLDYFLNKSNQKLGKNICGFEKSALHILTRYHWPGNVRELENALEYAVNFETGPLISPSSIQPRIQQQVSCDGQPHLLNLATDAFQKGFISDCLRQTGLSLAGKREAAARLGISESTLYRRIRELKIEPDVHT